MRKLLALPAVVDFTSECGAKGIRTPQSFINSVIYGNKSLCYLSRHHLAFSSSDTPYSLFFFYLFTVTCIIFSLELLLACSLIDYRQRLINEIGGVLLTLLSKDLFTMGTVVLSLIGFALFRMFEISLAFISFLGFSHSNNKSMPYPSRARHTQLKIYEVDTP